jgi:pilus assembly protein Flp/PilA
MSKIVKRLARFLKVEDGPTAVEYAVMLALVIVVGVTAIGNLGGQANATFSPPSAKLKATTR